MKKRDIVPLVVSIVVCQLAGVLGSLATLPAIPTWYAGLTKPELAPPNWVFGPVWTTLFVLMGVAAFLVWKQGVKKRHVRIALWAFAMQLCLNVLWSVVFFGMQNLGAAFVEVVIFWLAIATTTLLFYKISRTAAYLMLPYLAWVSFASYLTYMLWQLNG